MSFNYNLSSSYSHLISVFDIVRGRRMKQLGYIKSLLNPFKWMIHQDPRPLYEVEPSIQTRS